MTTRVFVYCVLCEEPVLEGEALAATPLVADGGRSLPVHHECLFREGYGGIGHHIDHDLWCTRRGDPDMGLGYRESARRALAHYESQRRDE